MKAQEALRRVKLAPLNATIQPKSIEMSVWSLPSTISRQKPRWAMSMKEVYTPQWMFRPSKWIPTLLRASKGVGELWSLWSKPWTLTTPVRDLLRLISRMRVSLERIRATWSRRGITVSLRMRSVPHAREFLLSAGILPSLEVLSCLQKKFHRLFCNLRFKTGKSKLLNYNTRKK